MAKALDHPLAQRIYHGINLLAIAGLTITGFYIHRPFTEGAMGLARSGHFLAMYILLINLVLRIYYAFLGKYKDAGEFSWGTKEWGNLWKTLKYYAFLGEHPVAGKYNPLQKLAYLTVVLLLVVQGVTGFALYRPELSADLAVSLGGLQLVRAIHFLTMWVLLAFTVTHIYMVFAETPDQVKLMFLGIAEEDEDRLVIGGGKEASPHYGAGGR